MTIIPAGEALQAEVWIGNQDAGFVHEGQPVRVKVVPFPFQKYGMADGRIVWVSADATDAPGGDRPAARYRAIVELPEQALEADGVRHRLTAGMLVSAEVHLGERRVYEYVVSPVTKAFSEAGRER
jgi:HlyD family secretion protein